MNTCYKCHMSKPISEFKSNPAMLKGYENICKSCTIIRQREHRIYRYYGIELEDYDKMAKDQEGKCLLCEKVPNGLKKGEQFHVDHDHITGKIRGLLCDTCNRGLGMFKESPELLLKASEYISKHRRGNLKPSLVSIKK